MKRYILPVILLPIGLVGSWWAFTHSYLKIEVQAPVADGEYVFTLTDGTGRTTEIKTKSPSVKRLVGKGDYEVLVRQSDTSYLMVAKMNGLLRTTEVSAAQVKEKARSYIGNDPGPCAYMVSGVLLSSACGGRVDKLQIHVPASATQPTYSKNSPTPLNGYIEGVVSTTEGMIVIVKAPGLDEDQGAPHTAYILGPDGNLTSGVPLGDLESEQTYMTARYRDGFLLYSGLSDQSYYYSSYRAKPSKITLEKPKDQTLKLQYLDTADQSIAGYYSTISAAENEVLQSGEVHSGVVSDSKKKKARSEVVVQDGSASLKYSLAGAPSSVRYCAQNRLCVLNDGALTIYDVSGKKLKRLLTLHDVSGIEKSSKGLLAARHDYVISLDIAKLQGRIEVSLGQNAFCGMRTQASSFGLCTKDENGKKVALLVNQEQENTDSINIKIEQLARLSEVKSVSIYGRYIYISPDIGNPQPNPQTGFFEYDKTTVKNANSIINQEVDRIGISRSAYTIINTIQ